MVNHPKRKKGKEPDNWEKALNAYANALLEFKSLRKVHTNLDTIATLEVIGTCEHQLGEAHRLATVAMHNCLHDSMTLEANFRI